MKLEDFFVMISLKILVMGYLQNIFITPLSFKNSEKSVKTQALINLRVKRELFYYLSRRTHTFEILCSQICA